MAALAWPLRAHPGGNPPTEKGARRRPERPRVRAGPLEAHSAACGGAPRAEGGPCRQGLRLARGGKSPCFPRSRFPRSRPGHVKGTKIIFSKIHKEKLCDVRTVCDTILQPLPLILRKSEARKRSLWPRRIRLKELFTWKTTGPDGMFLCCVAKQRSYEVSNLCSSGRDRISSDPTFSRALDPHHDADWDSLSLAEPQVESNSGKLVASSTTSKAPAYSALVTFGVAEPQFQGTLIDAAIKSSAHITKLNLI
ncbi:uncharacterized protein LOC113961257 [Neopelma chrysocephalum]|uniref:uncharacterized protein LOC113961257 n=1 Tax=Neopelma chrysocephalum TaxID=114329 RepID=UPI000FCD0A59|nr:uncharacterized protein LOC113961257 [Neopelma chrysocephalum]